MSTFIEVLEEIAAADPAVSISPQELESLVRRFGDRARQMGRWNASTDGSLDIPITVIREAVEELDSRTVTEALTEIKAETLNRALESSAAVMLIDRIRAAYSRHLRDLMTRYQSAANPSKTSQLRDQLVREIFGE